MGEVVMDKIIGLAGGNPGALRVVLDMAHLYPDALDLIEKSGLRKSNIWLAYKDFGDQTYETLYRNLTDPGFPAKVKASRYYEP